MSALPASLRMRCTSSSVWVGYSFPSSPSTGSTRKRLFFLPSFCMSLSTISTCSGLPKTGIDGVEIQSQIFPFPDYFLHLRRQIKKRKIIYACGLRRQNGSRQRANLHTHGRKDRNSDSQRSPSITGQIMHSGDTGDRRPDIFTHCFMATSQKQAFPS